MITDTQENRLLSLGAEYPDHPSQKFCQGPPAWFRGADKIARHLGLHESGPLSILDIGCGFGYFLAACTEYGHHCTGLDLPDALITNAARALQVRYETHEIKAFEPLPPTLREYDLITTFGVNFRFSGDEYWGRVAYAYLALDIRDRLVPDGKWVLRPNQTSDKSSRIANLSRADWWRQVAGRKASITVSLPEVTIRWPTD